MNMDIYDPKELLNTLVEIENQLEQAMDNYCPNSKLSFDVDPDKALKSFLDRQDVKGNEVGFLSTQIALQHLRHEVVKTKEVVIDTNSLRAWEGFLKWEHARDDQKIREEKNKESKLPIAIIGTKLNYLMLGIMVVCIMMTCYFFLFY